ncbi:MAG: hypothetical protein HQ512_04685 [Rhodospirillales bacterium]|nr:hypothetical protein [Rhodospirillales bacterium]
MTAAAMTNDKSPERQWPDHLTVTQAHEYIRDVLGLDLTFSQVKRAADDARLPFFKPFGTHARVINVDDLKKSIFKDRNAAINRMAS